jgi:lysophospholipase L1-like esterase
MNSVWFGFLEKIFGGANTKAAIAFLLAVFVFAMAVFELLLAALKAGRRTRVKARVILTAVFIALLAAELGLRWSREVVTYPENRFGRYESPYRCYGQTYWTWLGDHRLENEEYSFFRKVNSEGLSDREHETSKKKDEFRIIALGDSFTEGDGAEEADSWPRILERSLNERAAKRTFSVINAGVCGSDPAYGYVLLRDRLLKYRPDLVIVAMNDSDRMDFVFRGGLERFHRDGSVTYARPPAWEWLFGISHLSRLVIYAQGYDQTLRKSSDKKRLDREALAKIRATLLEFSRLARSEKFHLLAVFCPFQGEIAEIDFLFSGFARELESRDGIASLDLRRYFIEEEKLSREAARHWYWPLDRHPTAEGYTAIARGVEWKMREMGIRSIADER